MLESNAANGIPRFNLGSFIKFLLKDELVKNLLQSVCKKVI